jgi:lipoate-protein ligase A
MPWRLLVSPPLGGADNMALDEALMGRARRTGETVLRVYSWSTPVLSLGRNQRAAGVYHDGALARAGIEVVRRPTGGRALLHHREITYSVTAPTPADASTTTAYARINALLATALNALGVAARIATPATRASAPGPHPCFAEPAAGELVLGERKLVGSAQWRDGGALLQHGSILVDDDQCCIPELMRVPAAAYPSPATLRSALGRVPSVAELADALFTAVRSLEDGGAMPFEPEPETLAHAAQVATRHRDPQWVWRR